MAALKYSRQRESIKEFLMTRTDHPTADTVYENMKSIYPKYQPLELCTEIFLCFLILVRSKNLPALAAQIVLTAG